MFAFALAGALSLLASQAPPSGAAQAAYTEAVALVRAELWTEALPAADKAVTESPQWADPWLLRARIRQRLLPADAIAAAARSYDPRFDYEGARKTLAAISGDCDQYLSLAAPEAPGRSQAQTLGNEEKALMAELTRVETDGKQAIVRQAQAAEQQRKADELAREQAAREAQARAEADAKEQRRRDYEASVAGLRSARAAGITLIVIGSVTGAASLGMFLGSNALVNDVRTGKFATASDYAPALEQAGGLKTAALGTAIGSGALLLTGIILTAASGVPPPPQGVFVTFLVAGSPGVGFAGVWP